MSQCVLAGERETSWLYTTLLEYLAVMVKLPEGVIKGSEGALRDGVETCNITKFQEGRESLDDVNRNEAFERGDENFHECFRVIPSPLLEISPLLESTKAGEQGDQSDSGKEVRGLTD